MAEIMLPDVWKVKRKKGDICKERDYHRWEGHISSVGESYTQMDMDVTCADCGAHGWGKIYWED